MSRHTRHECNLPLFQIEVLDFSRKNGHAHSFGTDVIGINTWQYGGQTYSHPEKVKQADRVPCAPRKTLLKRFRDSKCAIRWGSRIGSVISCRKVDVEPYLKNIEHLNLHQEHLTIEIDKQEFELGRDFVITRSGMTVGEVIDK